MTLSHFSFLPQERITVMILISVFYVCHDAHFAIIIVCHGFLDYEGNVKLRDLKHINWWLLLPPPLISRPSSPSAFGSTVVLDLSRVGSQKTQLILR